MLNGEVVLGGNHALVEAELLAGVVVAAKERERYVEHRPRIVNLVRLFQVLICLIDQVLGDEVIMLQGNEVVTLHDVLETKAGPLPVTLIPWLDHGLIHDKSMPLKPQTEKCLQLGDITGLKCLA